jgi:hypothetical protein
MLFLRGRLDLTYLLALDLEEFGQTTLLLGSRCDSSLPLRWLQVSWLRNPSWHLFDDSLLSLLELLFRRCNEVFVNFLFLLLVETHTVFHRRCFLRWWWLRDYGHINFLFNGSSFLLKCHTNTGLEDLFLPGLSFGLLNKKRRHWFFRLAKIVRCTDALTFLSNLFLDHRTYSRLRVHLELKATWYVLHLKNSEEFFHVWRKLLVNKRTERTTCRTCATLTMKLAGRSLEALIDLRVD